MKNKKIKLPNKVELILNKVGLTPLKKKAILSYLGYKQKPNFCKYHFKSVFVPKKYPELNYFFKEPCSLTYIQNKKIVKCLKCNFAIEIINTHKAKIVKVRQEE